MIQYSSVFPGFWGLTTSGNSLNLGSSTFYFGMGLSNNGVNLLKDSTYIDTKMTYVVNSAGTKTSTTISFDTWNNSGLSDSR